MVGKPRTKNTAYVALSFSVWRTASVSLQFGPSSKVIATYPLGLAAGASAVVRVSPEHAAGVGKT